MHGFSKYQESKAFQKDCALFPDRSWEQEFAHSELFVNAKIRSGLNDDDDTSVHNSLMANTPDLNVDYPEPEKEGPGHFLRAWRKNRGSTQQELAAAIGISKSHLSEIETGEKVMSLKLLHKFAAALKVSAGYIVDYHPDSVPPDIFERFQKVDQPRQADIIRVVDALLSQRDGTNG